MQNFNLPKKQLKLLNSKKGLRALLAKEPYNLERSIRFILYEQRLKKMQTELIRMQLWARENNERIVVIFEGRDAAGKGGAIRRTTERMNPRFFKIVALPKPSADEKTQWYFQRYVEQLPVAGKIVLFDRSWYNRAIVEPVMEFCTQEEYTLFMEQVNNFEHMLVSSGIRLVKIYMSISKQEQAKRFEEIKSDPLKQWKMTSVDEKAQELWDQYTHYKNEMFAVTKEGAVPWKIIKANRKTFARTSVIKHILNSIPYDRNFKL